MYSSVFRDGSFVGVSTDAEATRECIGRVSPYDAEQWKAWSAAFDQTLATLFGLLQSPARPLAALSGAAGAGPGAQPLVSHLLLYPVRETLEARFQSEQVRGLVAAWGMHLDFAPDTPGGSLIPFLETNADARWGIGLAQGGSGTLTQALADLIRDTGGEVRLRATAHRIQIEDNRASSVEVGDAETIRCRRAVVTSVTPPALLRLTGDRLIERPNRRRRGLRAARNRGLPALSDAPWPLPLGVAGGMCGCYPQRRCLYGAAGAAAGVAGAGPCLSSPWRFPEAEIR